MEREILGWLGQCDRCGKWCQVEAWGDAAGRWFCSEQCREWTRADDELPLSLEPAVGQDEASAGLGLDGRHSGGDGFDVF